MASTSDAALKEEIARLTGDLIFYLDIITNKPTQVPSINTNRLSNRLDSSQPPGVTHILIQSTNHQHLIDPPNIRNQQQSTFARLQGRPFQLRLRLPVTLLSMA